MQPQISIDQTKLAAFCEKWKITELSLFGSVLREDFGPDSDVDVLVTFDPNADRTFWDFLDAQSELAEMLGRQVDLVEKRAVERSRNPIRRRAILSGAQVYYHA
jgi:uncharacterized protein